MNKKISTILTLMLIFFICVLFLFKYIRTPEPQYSEEVKHVPEKIYSDFKLDEVIEKPEIIIINTSTKDIATSSVDLVTSSQKIIKKPEAILPQEINLAVPFTSQAPEANWDQPWQDACEEAVVLMLDAYYKEYDLTKNIAIKEILKQVAWQDDLNWKSSINAEKVLQLLQYQIPNLQFKIIENPEILDIKKSIASGNPVFVVAAGKLLDNKHFTDGGPDYHALIIKGYTKTHFITNDPGTKWGENFQYRYDVLMNAIHDYNDGNVVSGTPRILMVK